MNVRQVRDAAGLRLGIEAVDEAGLDAGADVLEGERRDRGIQPGRQSGGVPVRLQLDAGQGVSRGFGFHDAGRLPVDEQHVVGETVAGRHPELAHGDAAAGGEVKRLAVLDDPARLGERRVDLPAGALLGGQRHRRPTGVGSRVRATKRRRS